MRYLCSTHYLRSIKGDFAYAYFACLHKGSYGMKEIKSFKSALKTASNDTAHYMTDNLRAEAHASGWPSKIVNRMRVDNEFNIHVHDKHKAEVYNLEYGTPNTQPTAAIRRHNNRTQEAEKFLIGRISKLMGQI